MPAPTLARHATRGFIHLPILVVLAAVGLTPLLGRKEFVPAEPSTEPPAPIVKTSSAALLRARTIHPLDVLTIAVPEQPELGGDFDVDSEGAITMPAAGKVQVGGLLPVEVSRRVAKALSSMRLGNPEVSVVVASSQYQTVFVLGEVRAPGAVTDRGGFTLLKALALSRVPVSAGQTVTVVRPETPGASGPTMPGSPRSVARTVSIAQPIELADGDTVIVPKVAVFYVLGEVRKPGAYIVEPGLTVEQALMLAGGTTDLAGSDARVVRIVDGKRIDIEASSTDAVLPSDFVRIRPRRF